MKSPDRLELELVERDAMRDLYGAAARSASSRFPFVRESESTSLFLTSDDPAMLLYNRALAWGDPDLRELSRVEATADALGAPWLLALADASPLRGCLEDRGYAPGYAWMKFFRRAERVRPVESDFRIARLRQQDAATFAELVERTFGLPEPLRAPIASLPTRRGWHCFGAFDGESLVATGSAFVRDGRAWLGLAATAPQARRRGAQSALLAARVAAAADAGVRWVAIETGVRQPGKADQSYRNILAAGFEEAYVRPNFIRLPNGHA